MSNIPVDRNPTEQFESQWRGLSTDVRTRLIPLAQQLGAIGQDDNIETLLRKREPHGNSLHPFTQQKATKAKRTKMDEIELLNVPRWAALTQFEIVIEMVRCLSVTAQREQPSHDEWGRRLSRARSFCSETIGYLTAMRDMQRLYEQRSISGATARRADGQPAREKIGEALTRHGGKTKLAADAIGKTQRQTQRLAANLKAKSSDTDDDPSAGMS